MSTASSAVETPHILRPPYRDEQIDLGKEWDPPELRCGSTTQELGAWGEEVAYRHLRARSIQILERNWRCRRGEIDLICYDPARGSIFACEVKTRRDHGRVPAIESVSRAKLARLRQLLAFWISTHNMHAELLEIDVIAITVSADHSWSLCHIEGVL
ncbi:YraN family protein [Ancrocorticia populi]|uniref:YraN family protein n=1 Tax=Ancrocorticia populi TaxID=2175228 RepID=UPI002704C5DF|nr:YraN family protein [Ancrocorticia sp.]